MENITKHGSMSVRRAGLFFSTAFKHISVASANVSWHKNAHGSKQESRCSLSDNSQDNF